MCSRRTLSELASRVRSWLPIRVRASDCAGAGSGAEDSVDPIQLGPNKAKIALFVTYLLCLVLGGLYVVERYGLRVNLMPGKGCLDYDVFLVDLADHDIHRGDYVEFVANSMGPFYPRGTHALKIVGGIPGDHLVVSEQGVWVNGRYWGPLTHVQPNGKLWLRGRRPREYVRDETVPDRHLCLLGNKPLSYDCRYWGYVDTSEIVGRAYPLW